MDYESGKIPNKKDSAPQTIRKTQPQDQFASSVKIVGDDVTEKDYDTFFEGFNSAREKPLWQERKFQQEPKIQKLPGRLSVDGEPKIEKLPYTPSEAARTKISLYSGVTPAYTQAKNTYQKPEETWQDRLKDSWDNLPQNIYAANVMATTKNPLGGLLRIAAGRALEEHVKQKHYERNQYNVDLPENADEAKAWDWKTVVANCHQFTAPDGKEYIKYVSPDGKREIIVDSDGNIVTADEDMGTYNYADPKFLLEHGLLDVLPWMRYGNTPEDSTEWYERIGGFLFG